MHGLTLKESIFKIYAIHLCNTIQYNTIITWSSAPLSRHHYGSARKVQGHKSTNLNNIDNACLRNERNYIAQQDKAAYQTALTFCRQCFGSESRNLKIMKLLPCFTIGSQTVCSQRNWFLSNLQWNYSITIRSLSNVIDFCEIFNETSIENKLFI